MMASKTDKLRQSFAQLSLYEKQKLFDELLKDGRIDYPFKEKHQQEILELEEKIKERLKELLIAEENFKTTIKQHPSFAKRPIIMTSVQKDLEQIFLHYEHQYIDEWLCECIIEDISKITLSVTSYQKETNELLPLFVCNVRKISPLLSSSLSLFRFLNNFE